MAGVAVPIQRGGTSQTTAAGARKALGLEIGTTVQPYDPDLDAIAALATNGIIVRTGSGTATTRTIIAPAAGITISNGDGVAGNPTLALADDLAAYEGLSTTGIVVRSAANTAVTRTITGTANKITVTNGSGTAGDPTLTLPDAVTLVTPTVTGAAVFQSTVDITGAFTSLGIDDNATGERLQIADTEIHVGPNDTSTYRILRARSANDAAIELSGGNALQEGARFILFGQSHSTLADEAFLDASTFNLRNAAGTAGGLLNLTGGQIKFPTTPNLSSDPNTMDDYERGSFTPTIVGTSTSGTGTYSIQVGVYQKIGPWVHFHIALAWSAHTGTGNMNVGAVLPFAPDINAVCAVEPVNVALTAGNFMTALVQVDSTVLLRQIPTGGGANTAVPIDTSVTNLRISGTYRTAS